MNPKAHVITITTLIMLFLYFSFIESSRVMPHLFRVIRPVHESSSGSTYNFSSSPSFTPEVCKELLKKWYKDIDSLEFKNLSDARQAFLEIPGGKRIITFIYTMNNTFEGCNILDIYDTNLDKKEKQLEAQFDCEKKEICKVHTFENGRLLYVYKQMGDYYFLKYLLRTKGKEGAEKPSLTFQVFYIQRNMTSFIQHMINRAKRGYGCG